VWHRLPPAVAEDRGRVGLGDRPRRLIEVVERGPPNRQVIRQAQQCDQVVPNAEFRHNVLVPVATGDLDVQGMRAYLDGLLGLPCT
jgi:hypothetical protein